MVMMRGTIKGRQSHWTAIERGLGGGRGVGSEAGLWEGGRMVGRTWVRQKRVWTRLGRGFERFCTTSSVDRDRHAKVEDKISAFFPLPDTV
jgi:hypothetical protein